MQNSLSSPQAAVAQAPPLTQLLASSFNAPNATELMTSAAKVSLNTGLNLTKRLYNGVADVVRMFLPSQLGKTIKNTLLGTAGLSAFSFILTGPFHLPALPAFAMASLGFDIAWTFVGGLLRSPNQPYTHSGNNPPAPALVSNPKNNPFTLTEEASTKRPLAPVLQ